MPRVPSYDTAQVQQQPTGPIRLQALAPDTDSIAQGIGSFQRGAEILAAKERERADTALLMDADNQLTQWQQKAMYDEQGGVLNRKGKNALDVTNQTLEQFDQTQAEIAKNLTNDRQRARYAEIVSRRRNSLSNDLNRYEYGERQNYYGEVEKAQLETSMQGAALDYQDPAKVQGYRQKIDAVLASRAERLGLSPEAADAERLSTNSGMSTAVIQRMLVDSPQKAKSYFESFKGTMTAEDQIRASNGIDQGYRRLEAEARQRQVEARQIQAINRMELSSRVQDASAAYSQGLDFANPPSLADFRAAYGDKADDQYKSFAKVQAIAPAIREFATATPQERQEILGKFQPAQGGVAGEGFKEDNQLYQHLTSVGVSLMKQQQDDPAAYTVKYSPVVQRAFAVAQEEGTPEAYRAYANATVAEQQRLGVAQPKLLPDAAADQLAANFNLKVGGGENAATMIEEQQALWGKDFPAVLQQVGNKLPAEAQVIATGLPKDLAERMASVASLKDKDLDAGLLKGQKDEVSQNVQAAMQPFAESLQGQSGGISTYSTMYKAAVRTAASYVLQGDSPKEAAQRVVDGMVNDKYDFFGTYRVPKSYDTNAVSRGADEALRTLQPDDLFVLQGLPGVTNEQNAQQNLAAVQGSAQWVPTGDESGLALTNNGYRVIGKDGKPVIRTWEQLQTEGLSKPAPAAGRVRGLGIYN